MTKYRLLKRNENCVLLQNLTDFTYKVRDVENYDVFVGHSYDVAMEAFNKHDLKKLHEGQKEQFEKYLKEVLVDC